MGEDERLTGLLPSYHLTIPIFFLSGFYLPLFKDGFISIYRFRKN